MALWGGRFAVGPAESVVALSRSVQFDWRLAPYDIRVNIAHVHGLERSGLLSKDEMKKITDALRTLQSEILSGVFTYNDADEDVHSAIERGLFSKIGELAGAFRAGRSRNDLVATDFKLYCIDNLIELGQSLTVLVDALNSAAEATSDVIAPGFTHYQHAQPISFGHEIAKHSHAFLRDISRIGDWIKRNAISPLGSGALAGSALQLDPEKSAEELGFNGVHGNSIDAVSDRDWANELLFIAAEIGVHLSRLGEEFTLWASTEFGWITLDDAFSTGSSIMPQKKNPDIAELARGKSGRLIGNLTTLLVVSKGLAFAYNRDLQEDKEPVFDSFETLELIIPAVVGMIQTVKFNKEKISSGAVKGHALATEIADYLARQGVPFSSAHEISGACVKKAESLGCDVHELSDADLASVDARLDGSLRKFLTAEGALSSRTSSLSASPKSVEAQLSELSRKLKEASAWISSERKSFSGMMSS